MPEIDIGHIGIHKHPVLQKKFFAVMLMVCVLLIVSGCVQQGSVEPQNTFINSIGMEFVQIPAGEFNMGSSENYQNITGKDDERPLHHVVLSKSFYMGKYEVTQKQWREVMGTEPSLYKGDDLPVDQVSWDDVHEFIKKLNGKEGTYLFNWDKIPGNDSGRFIDFLKKKYSIDWVNAGKTEKIDNGNTIRVSVENNYLLLSLSKEKNMINLIIDDGRTDTFYAETENGELNIYESTNKYRLPSEAEWEYSARAGTSTKYSFGDNEFKLGDYAWYYYNSVLFTIAVKTHPVGHKKPNAWGLYDMYGNVWEWVQDKYHSNYSGAPTDGSAWESGSSSNRIARGGGFTTYTIGCRSAYRGPDFPSDRTGGLGFRLLRDL